MFTRLKLRNRFILLIVLVQILLIIFLCFDIYIKRQLISVNPINKNDIIINPAQNLSNFYEPKPNSVMEYKYKSIVGEPGIATINADRLNERFDYKIEKGEGTYRIITLGDSYTFGWYVDTKQNYPEQLEDKLNNSLSCDNIKKFEVINLGMGGYDIEFSVHRYNVRGQKYNPDLILWFLRDNDFEEISDFIFNYLAKKSREASDPNNSNISTSKVSEANIDWSNAIKELSKKTGKDVIVSRQKAKLYSLDDLFKNKLLLFTHSYTSQPYQDILMKFSQQRPSTYFYNSLPKMSIPDEAFADSHPTAKGYTKITNHIFEYITANNLIPCQ